MSQYADDGEVTIWRIDTRDESFSERVAFTVLSESEIIRARSFRSDKRRRSFVVARSLARVELGRRMGVAPRAVRIADGANGKPVVDGTFQFSTSHSGRLSVLAVAGSPIGVDVERIVPFAEIDQIAREHLTAADIEWINAANSVEKINRFFSAWTRFEASAKVAGHGIVNGGVVFCDMQSTNIDVATGFAGAVAAEKKITRVRFADSADTYEELASSKDLMLSGSVV